MSTYSIELTRSAQLPHDVGSVQGYTFTVTASNPVGMSAEIFRMYEQPLDPIAQTRTPVYDGITTPDELISLPINSPVAPDYHYRVASIDVTYMAVVTGDEAWESIKEDVEELVSALAAAERLSVVESVEISSEDGE